MSRRIAAALLLAASFAAEAAPTFYWGYESGTATLGADDYSAADTAGSASGGVSISSTGAKVGSYGLSTTNAQDYHRFDPTSIAITGQGVIAGWIQFKGSVPTQQQVGPIIFRNTANSNDVISIGASSTGNDVRLFLQRNGGSSLDLVATGCNFVVDTWYFVLGRWNISADDRFVACYDSSGSLIDSNEDLTTDLANVEPTAIDEMRVGNSSTFASAIWVDNVFVSQTYADAVEDYKSITSFYPSFTSAPVVNTATGTTLPIDFTLDQTGTVYGVACPDGQTATRSQIIAGNCSGGAAVSSWSEGVTAGAGDSHTFTGLSAGTTYDLFFTATSGLGAASKTNPTLNNQATTGGGGGGGGYPSVLGVQLTSTTATTSHSVAIPGSSCSNGQLLAGVIASSDVANDFTFSGYTSIAQRLSNSEMGEVFYRECDGSEGASFTVTSSVSAPAAAVVYKLSGTDFAADPETTTTGGSASTTPDPPSLTPTGGAKNYLWITVAVQDENAGTFTSCPTNYTTNCASGGSGAGGGGSDEVKIAYSYRTNNATSEDPGVFTFSTSDTWDAYTIAIHPGSAAVPAFDSGPNVSSQTTAAYTIAYDANADADTIFCGAWKKDATAPTAAQVESGTNAVATATEAATGSSDTVTVSIGGGDPFPLYDLYCVLEEGTSNYTSVAAMLDEPLDEPTGRNYVTKSGSPGAGEEGILDDASPAAADGDIMDVPEYADSFDNGSASALLTVAADTTYQVQAGGNTNRHRIYRRFYDVSAADWSDSSPVLYCINDKAPVYAGPESDDASAFLFEKNAAMSLSLDSVWGDPEDDALTHNTTGLPTGLTDDGETVSGTPTTLGYYSSVDLEATDICGEVETETVEFVIGLRLPDVVSWLKDESLWRTRSIFTGAGA